MPGTHVSFTPSAAATFQSGLIPALFTLPTADGANPAVVLRNLGPGVLAVLAGTTGQPVGGMPGAITLQPGQTLLLASHPGFGGGAVATVQGGGRLEFTRGVLADLWMFPAPSVAVI